MRGKPEKKQIMVNKDIIGIWQMYCSAWNNGFILKICVVEEKVNDLLPAGSKIKFNIDKKNMRITQNLNLAVRINGIISRLKNVAIEI